MILATRDSAVLAERSTELEWIDAAIAAEHDDGARGSLLLDRAIAQQGEADPSRPARDSVQAFELLIASGHTDQAAFAAAVAGAMLQRAGDVEAAVDYAVEAMALVDISDRTLMAARAANSISTLFAQLSAFTQAFTYSSLSADICAEQQEPLPMAVCYTSCYIAVEAHHAGVSVPLDRARAAVEQLTNDANPVAKQFLGPGMAAELLNLDRPDQIGATRLDSDGLEHAAPRLQAWFRLVLAMVANGAKRHDEATELLDIALPTLITLGDEHRVVRAYRMRSDSRAALGDMDGALSDANVVADTVRRWQIDQVGRLAVQISHRAELEQMQSTLQRRAVDLVRQINIDELTRTGSRRLLESRLDEIEREDGTVSVAIVDIDNFKQVNDDYGHVVGDEVLKRVGAALRASNQASTVLARYGGDEFVAVFNESGTSAAETFANDVMRTLSSTNWGDLALGLDIYVSAGIARGRSSDVRDIVQHADGALYSAKRSGRNRCVIA